MRQGYVYILASKYQGTLYVGATSNLIKRVYEHKQGLIDGFTKKYRVKSLVYYEIYDDLQEAFLRELQLKKWKRAWKIELIEKNNSGWNDLYSDILS
ncbi:GIY-YIG nuclease family protein [Kangiella sp. TOML190]|uniref:GIY-YIG nuclease family protein n=1 Tax=Kangiella sp. TOML190 TaxID=2931351 RepID=UPI002040BA48|nr:GIY-YIG nuclease family protein [Kangiella sp. TOML190]